MCGSVCVLPSLKTFQISTWPSTTGISGPFGFKALWVCREGEGGAASMTETCPLVCCHCSDHENPNARPYLYIYIYNIYVYVYIFFYSNLHHGPFAAAVPAASQEHPSRAILSHESDAPWPRSTFGKPDFLNPSTPRPVP